jgi:hypothetical protein
MEVLSPNLIFYKALPEFAGREMVATNGTVFFTPLGSTAIVFVVKEVVFGFFPGNVSAEPFAHVPSVLIDGMAVLANLPFIEL